MTRRSVVALLLAVAAAAGGCGSSDKSGSATTAAGSATSTGDAPATGALSLPPGVPTKGTGPADDDAATTIKGWLAALTNGDVEKAGDYFGEPAKVQNGTPVLTLKKRTERVGFNATFPCGARATRLQSADDGFTIVTFRLTQRRGGDCGSGTGGAALAAIKVKDKRIVEWYRLPDDGNATPKPPEVTDPGIGVA